MSKRKLSKQQQSRISANQQKKLAGNEECPAGFTTYNNCNGRIISHFGRQLDVEDLDPARQGKLIRCRPRANLPELVTGDFVVWEQEAADSGIILAVAERRNSFNRPGFGGRLKPVAANLDVVLVVVATTPRPFMNLIDRYLVAIATLGLDCMLVLNKTDLLDEQNRQGLHELLSVYENMTFPVLRVSAKQGHGMDAMAKSLRGKTTVLAGQSGVGKSSLINRLGGRALADTSELSAARDKGTHTTTTARLFHLGGFDLIDSPGIREFELPHIDPAQVAPGFPDVMELAHNCKFRDCRHDNEPDCAVREAVTAGRIHQNRLASYRQILRSLTAG